MSTFSNLNRVAIGNKLAAETFDLLVIGGGITGAGIALDAASRGFNVALVEQNDFASGTSSKSTKLIHGGLRYLKQFDFWLVKEVGSERAILHKLAPHLVVPDKMLLPIIENGTYGSWLTSFGLKVYDLLANVEGEDKRLMLDKKTTLTKEPLLPTDILEGAGYYAEYRTDDARLTIEVLKTAVHHGAVALNYVKVKALLHEEGAINGAMVHDEISDKDFQIKARYVINATGPWVDDIREEMDTQTATRTTATKDTQAAKDSPTTTDIQAAKGTKNFQLSKRLQLTKGVHLVFPFEKLPVQQSVYFDVPDGRMIFAIPRGKITYVGTTDTKFDQEQETVSTELVDALYLINAVNHMFPSIELEIKDIISSWAGLRPLIYEEGKSAGELSRKDEIFEAPSGLISIAGGKLTGYRKMAERTVDVVVKRATKKSNKTFKPVQTEHIALTPKPFNNYKEVKTYVEHLLPAYEPYGLSKTDIESLVHRFGRQTDPVLEKFRELPEENAVLRLAKAELWFGIHHEMIVKPLDFFERRSGRLFFEPQTLEPLKEPILKEFSSYFNWNKQTYLLEKEQLDKAIMEITTFD